MKSKTKIYVASPYGFSEAGREFMYGKMIPILEKHFEVIDPWKLTDPQLIDSVLKMPYGIERKNAWSSLNMIIGRNNIKGMRKSNGMVAVLDGTNIDDGTSGEIGYEYGLGKPILGYKGDFRLTSDNEGSLVNLQIESFIYESGGKIITSILDLENEALKLFLKAWH